MKTTTILALFVLATLSVSVPTMSMAATTITLQGNDTGRSFDGFGGLSAGASSRLLFDYPEPQRSEILDYLFKPHFGASLQICKVEIGGDVNSTDGSEASHMHSENDENYHRGYEWWLMTEAKRRNKNIKLYALEWGAPGWVNPTGKNVWTDNNITYILNFIKHAKSDYGLHIDYVGGWNERQSNPEWYKKLRTALDQQGLSSVKIVTDDSFHWSVVPTLQKDADYLKSVDIVGQHYIDTRPKDSNDPNDLAAQSFGKPLWQSEMGWQGYNGGAANIARQLNRGYIDDKITGNINWSTIWSVYPGFPFGGSGLMLADEPWSGHYEIGTSIWASAHTTQFCPVGWQYLDHACGFFDGDPSHGSYVTLKDPKSADYTVVMETGDSTLTASMKLGGGVSTKTVHIWRTDLRSQNSSNWFVRLPDISPSNGEYDVDLLPNCVYSLTTTTGQSKGQPAQPIPASHPFPLPYKDDFSASHAPSPPKFFSDIQGSFEIGAAHGGRNGNCVRQCAVASPVFWGGKGNPLTLLGSREWRDYTVTSDVLLEQPGIVGLLGRAVHLSDQGAVGGYVLRVADTGAWSLVVTAKKSETVLESGTVLFSTNTWHTLSLTFDGDAISAEIDGLKVVDSLHDTQYSSGYVGYLVGSWEPADFQRLSVVPVASERLRVDDVPSNLVRVLRRTPSGLIFAI